MVVKRRVKQTRMRGSKANKHGSRKKHRGSGNRGGRGNAGTGKRADHKRMSTFKKEPRYFGKYGFVHHQRMEGNAINIDQLPLETKIDLTKMGFSKLLSRGIPVMKHEITVVRCSEEAKKKIEAAGGKIILTKDASEADARK